MRNIRPACPSLKSAGNRQDLRLNLHLAAGFNRYSRAVLTCLGAVSLMALLPAPAQAAQGSTQHESADQPSVKAYGPELQGYHYAWPVKRFHFSSQQQQVQMAYLDIKPEHPNGRTAVLLHGKNFCSGTWKTTIEALSKQGYRVIAPDQLGFCMSSKPTAYQFSFEQLASNTHALLKQLGIHHYVMIGHSTGGMLAARYALMYPSELQQLVMVDPLGLEDWRAKGVPYHSIDEWYKTERKTSAASIRAYEQKVYYAGQWSPTYDKWVNMLAGMYKGPGRDQVAYNSAQIYNMIYTQPVIHEFPDIKVPTLLMIGDKDITAPGGQFASKAVQKTLGHYPALAKSAVKAIPNARLIEFPDYGHAPQIQAPAEFNQKLIQGIQDSH